jgi:dTDP-4-dehydrorhamnose 3,5-epimerase
LLGNNSIYAKLDAVQFNEAAVHFTRTRLDGAWIIDPSPHHDERGRFMRAWCTREFEDHGIRFLPVQANMQFSPRRGTVRGLHLQVAPALEAKLVRCTRGAIFDVAVDLRPASPTFGEWCGVELTAENGRMLYVPEHCAHGFQSTEDDTEVLYLTSAFYAPESCRGARFDDPAFDIRWPLPPSAISEQDRNWPLMRDQRGALEQDMFAKEKSL